MGDARDGDPQITVAPLEAEADHQFIDFQSIAFARRQERIREIQARFPRLFLSTSRTVVRATRKVRAMARWDNRSCKAPAMKAAFSLLKVRLLSSGAHAF